MAKFVNIIIILFYKDFNSLHNVATDACANISLKTYHYRVAYYGSGEDNEDTIEYGRNWRKL